jgi:hypothetical protein
MFDAYAVSFTEIRIAESGQGNDIFQAFRAAETPEGKWQVSRNAQYRYIWVGADRFVETAGSVPMVSIALPCNVLRVNFVLWLILCGASMPTTAMRVDVPVGDFFSSCGAYFQNA